MKSEIVNIPTMKKEKNIHKSQRKTKQCCGHKSTTLTYIILLSIIPQRCGPNTWKKIGRNLQYKHKGLQSN